jgi:hypothetical protein
MRTCAKVSERSLTQQVAYLAKDGTFQKPIVVVVTVHSPDTLSNGDRACIVCVMHGEKDKAAHP